MEESRVVKEIVVKIYHCIECPNCSPFDGECSESGRTANCHPGDPIPDWCLLPDVEER